MFAERLDQVQALAGRASDAGKGIDFAVAFVSSVLLAVIHRLNLKDVLEVTVLFFDLVLVVWRIGLLWADRKKRKSIVRELREEE